MKIKVCGMRDSLNIEDLCKLKIDFMGLIFYPKSPRYVEKLDSDIIDKMPDTIARVGVFVNAEINEVLDAVKKYRLKYVQLHGNESVEYCQELAQKGFGISIIKAFSVLSADDFNKSHLYESSCDYFLLDTKTPQYGGSGIKFDWNILNEYKGNRPFFLSGGISIEDVETIKDIKHPQLVALDLNSKFETEPALKDIQLLSNFLEQLRTE